MHQAARRKGFPLHAHRGHEFVAIVTDCSEANINSKVQALRKRMDTPQDVSLAVGSYYVTSGCDIRTALRIADENMYKDKKAYYSKHPEYDRRKQQRD